MERLTRKINGVVVYVGAKNPYSTGQIPCEVEPAGVREMMDRLAAYEDSVVHWVFTDEKFPPEGQDVLCWYEYFRFGEYNRMYQTFGIGYQFNGNWGGEVVQGQKAKVLAWMPLPKPPKMEGGESGETD